MGFYSIKERLNSQLFFTLIFTHKLTVNFELLDNKRVDYFFNLQSTTQSTLLGGLPR
jgi:hypothetical protein